MSNNSQSNLKVKILSFKDLFSFYFNILCKSKFDMNGNKSSQSHVFKIKLNIFLKKLLLRYVLKHISFMEIIYPSLKGNIVFGFIY